MFRRGRRTVQHFSPKIRSIYKYLVRFLTAVKNYQQQLFTLNRGHFHQTRFKMVNIAIAGGSGRTCTNSHHMRIKLTYTLLEVSKEIIDALIASKKHTITILSRKVGIAR